MKTILVPTDFSASAAHASLYAAELAKATNASVLLLHVYQIPVSMSDFPVLLISAEDLKNSADESLKRAKQVAQEAVPGVQFETESKLGDVVDEIEDSCSNRDVVAVVTGIEGKNGFEKFLLGNTALSIVQHCNLPVITVPEDAIIKLPKKIALAVDDDDTIPVEKIKAFVELVSAELHIVHVETEEESLPVHLPAALTNATYHSLKEDDVAKGLHHFAEQNAIDLLLILPHKHNLLERLFFRGHTAELVNKMTVPVLCIRESAMSNQQ